LTRQATGDPIVAMAKGRKKKERAGARGAERGGSLVTEIVRTNRELLVAFERGVGMTQARLQLLGELERADEGGLRQAALQRRLGVDGAVITRQVRQLEREGLVVRNSDPADRRSLLVELTGSGRDLLARLADRRRALEAAVAGGLRAAEAAALLDGLRRIRRNLQAAERPDP
jgi:DNA-binding MarR family transcriptional regulator